MTKHYVYPDDKPEVLCDIQRWYKSSIWIVGPPDGLVDGNIWRYDDSTPSLELQARATLLRKRDGR